MRFARDPADLIVSLIARGWGHDWSLTDEVIDRLRATAPPVPADGRALPSFRIRTGTGAEGVRETCVAHIAVLNLVYGTSSSLEYDLLTEHRDSSIHLRNGDAAHAPVVEWCLIDPAPRRASGDSALVGADLVADEGLVFAWLYPEYIRAIDYERHPALVLGGYSLSLFGFGAEPEFGVPVVSLSYKGACELCVSLNTAEFDGAAVPALRG